jgi:hypothetical protein
MSAQQNNLEKLRSYLEDVDGCRVLTPRLTDFALLHQSLHLCVNQIAMAESLQSLRTMDLRCEYVSRAMMSMKDVRNGPH